MWLSEKRKSRQAEYTTGKVSISGDKCAVMDFSESRGASVFAPGGYTWKPERGDEVLVFKDGSADIVGKLCEGMDLEPGEVRIRSAGGAEIFLCNDGNVYIKGNVVTEGGALSLGNET